MVQGTTRTGFEFEVDKDQLTNAEFLEKFSEMQHGDSLMVFELLAVTLGKDQKKKLYDHCRNEKGMVPVEALTDELTDIFGAMTEADETKN